MVFPVIVDKSKPAAPDPEQGRLVFSRQLQADFEPSSEGASVGAERRESDVVPVLQLRNVGLRDAHPSADLQPLDRHEASLLFRLVSARYEKGSILITTNKAIKDWPEVLAGDEVMATALLDRLLHRCHVLNIKGRSYRLRDLERLIQGGGEPPHPNPGG